MNNKNSEQQNMDKPSLSDKAVANTVNNHLDALDDQLSTELSRRLYQARRNAVAAAKTPERSRFTFFRVFTSVSALAASVLIVILVSSTDSNVQTSPSTVNELVENINISDDSELMLNTESLDFYEDLEFYTWLAEIDVEHS